MQPDLPEPVVPAISRCGMRARSVQTALPEMSLPSQTASGLADCGRSSKTSPSVTRFGLEVRHLDADGLLARDRREDPDLGRGQRVGEVVLERGDLANLRSGCKLQLVAGDARARDLAADGRVDAEVGQRLDECRRHAGTGLRRGTTCLLRLAQHAPVGEPVLLVHGLGGVEERRLGLLLIPGERLVQRVGLLDEERRDGRGRLLRDDVGEVVNRVDERRRQAVGRLGERFRLVCFLAERPLE